MYDRQQSIKILPLYLIVIHLLFTCQNTKIQGNKIVNTKLYCAPAPQLKSSAYLKRKRRIYKRIVRLVYMNLLKHGMPNQESYGIDDVAHAPW